MSEPLIFVTTHAIHDGAAERIEDLGKRFIAAVSHSDSPPLAFEFYLDESRSQVSNVQVHRDAAAMDAYLAAARERIAEALELSTTRSIDVYGSPGPTLQEVLRRNADQGVPVRVHTARIGAGPAADGG